jgi:RNA recognition motif-containing protein
MKSPNISTVVIAAIFAIIAFFVFSTISATPAIIAAFVFLTAFVAPLASTSSDQTQESSSASDSDNDSDVKTLYVGNLPYRANEAAVRELFSTYGNVESVRLMKDKHTGKRRGFGFVEMSSNDLEKAITALNDAEFQQRTLKVREAKERPERVEETN